MASKAAAKPAAGSKAKKGAASLVKGSGRKGARTHTKVHFFRPKTLKLARAPKLKKIPTATKSALAKSYDVIKHPLTSETAMKQIEELNTLVFIVDIKANKKDIKRAVKALYDVTAAKVNTLIRPDGLKKAYVKLTPDHEASEIASRIGIIWIFSKRRKRFWWGLLSSAVFPSSPLLVLFTLCLS